MSKSPFEVRYNDAAKPGATGDFRLERNLAPRALLLVNRKSRQGGAQPAAEILKQAGLDVIEQAPDSKAALANAIRQHKSQVDLVVVGGGDGSLNAAAEALVETQLPLGILPLGTANDLARTLGLPTDLPPRSGPRRGFCFG